MVFSWMGCLCGRRPGHDHDAAAVAAERGAFTHAAVAQAAAGAVATSMEPLVSTVPAQAVVSASAVETAPPAAQLVPSGLVAGEATGAAARGAVIPRAGPCAGAPPMDGKAVSAQEPEERDMSGGGSLDVNGDFASDAGEGPSMATFLVLMCFSSTRELGRKKVVHAWLGRHLWLVWDTVDGRTPMSVEEFRKRHPRHMRLSRSDAEMRQALPCEAAAAGENCTDRVLFVRGMEQSVAPGGGDLSTLTLLLKAPSAAMCAAWAAAGAALLCPWQELLSPATGGSNAAVEVEALLEVVQQHAPLVSNDCPPGVVAKALGSRGRRRILTTYHWLRSTSPVVAGGARAAGSVASAANELSGVPVVGAALGLTLFVVQVGVLSVLADEYDAIRVGVAERCKKMLVLLLEATAETLQRKQTKFSVAHGMQLCAVIERVERMLGEVEVSYFSSRLQTMLLEASVRGWDEELRVLYDDLLRLTKEGELGHAAESSRLHACTTLPGAGVGTDLAAYGAPFEPPAPEAGYVPGTSTEGRSEYAVVSALQSFNAKGGATAPRLGICAIGGSGKSTACEGVAASAYVRERYSRGVVWVQLSSTSSAQTLADAAIALIYRFHGADTARQLLRLPADHDIVGVAERYQLSMPQSNAAGWMVVIDNVLDSQREILRQLLRVVPQRTPVLFTTRAESVVFSTPGAKLVPIDALPELDARLVLANTLGRDATLMGTSPFTDDEEEAWVRTVVDKTGRHALSLSVVGSLIAARGGGWGIVVRALEERWLSEDSVLSVTEGALAMRRSVRATLKTSLDLLPDAVSRSAFEAVGILPTNVKVCVNVLERLWRSQLHHGATAGNNSASSGRAVSTYAERDVVDRLVDVLVRAGLMRREMDNRRGEVAFVIVHPVIGEYARSLLGENYGAVHTRLVDDYMSELQDGGGVDEDGLRVYPFCKTQDDGYWYDHVARHSAASMSIGALLSLLSPSWKEVRVRTGSPLAYQAHVEILLSALLTWTRDTASGAQRPPAQQRRACQGLATAYRQRIDGSRAENVETAISLLHKALEFTQRSEAPTRWANVQVSLGNAYSDRVGGEKTENDEQALACYGRALEVWTKDTAPQDWAMVQNNLGIAYRDRVRGDRAANVEEALACYRRALEVRTMAAMPLEWATTQNNMGMAYRSRIGGDTENNVEEALECYKRALEVWTKESAPLDWAMTQNNMGIAYSDRVSGDRAANLEEALACYGRALEVRTRETAPLEWATTQNNMGTAYGDRVDGDAEENVEQALACYGRALEVWTKESAPLDWTMTQNNMGSAYGDRVRGDRAANVAEEIACYRRVLDVWTRETSPQGWATTSFNLMWALKDSEQWTAALDTARALQEFGSRWAKWPVREEAVAAAVAAIEAGLARS